MIYNTSNSFLLLQKMDKNHLKSVTILQAVVVTSNKTGANPTELIGGKFIIMRESLTIIIESVLYEQGESPTKLIRKKHRKKELIRLESCITLKCHNQGGKSHRDYLNKGNESKGESPTRLINVKLIATGEGPTAAIDHG